MAITASLVKELRERTGAGMMECKKALVETNGDIDGAIELMRKSGAAKADKKAGRIAAEGRISIQINLDKKNAAIVEVNCETDFVGNGDELALFADNVTKRVLNDKPNDLKALSQMAIDKESDATIDDTRRAMVVKIGENIAIRRFQNTVATDFIGSYLHGSRIGVLVSMEGGNGDLAKDIAMHIAASKPVCVSESEVPADLLAKERDIFSSQAKESGKPDNIIEKMVAGRVKKYLAEVTLTGQAFVKDPDITVGQLLEKSNAKVSSFIRFEVGEGIEKQAENFADEVMAQVRGT